MSCSCESCHRKQRVCIQEEHTSLTLKDGTIALQRRISIFHRGKLSLLSGCPAWDYNFYALFLPFYIQVRSCDLLLPIEYEDRHVCYVWAEWLKSRCAFLNVCPGGWRGHKTEGLGSSSHCGTSPPESPWAWKKVLLSWTTEIWGFYLFQQLLLLSLIP